MTIFSPYTEGSDDILRSIFLFSYLSVLLPSCGDLRLVIARLAIIFILDMTDSCICLGYLRTFLRLPSTRYLTCTCFSCGSIWISLALDLTASTSTMVTSLTMGGASLRLYRD